MDQALSLYLLDTVPLVDPQQPDYALLLLTLVESILEDPDIILRKQLDKVKDQKMAEMKFEGIEYDQRMEELEKLEHPKPNREFIYSTFNAFANKHPWVGQENIRPKSIAREMFESFRSFSDYIRDYELQRAEGVLLRHLNRVYKVLTQNVPDAAKNDQVREMELYLDSMIRQVDSSLLDEWEKMRDPNFQRAETKELRPPGAEEAALDVTRDTKAFTAVIRNRIFTFLRGLVNGDFETALESLGSPLTPALAPAAGARENSPPSQHKPAIDDNSATAEVTGTGQQLFPLPRGGGEGQGEGERAEKEHSTPNIQHPTPNVPLTPTLSPSEGERGISAAGLCARVSGTRRTRTTEARDFARHLRREETDAEKRLWRLLRKRRFEEFKFRRQYPCGIYFLDFFCVAARLAVELDGGGHGFPDQRARDETRSRFLADQRIKVLRFWNHQVRRETESVRFEIWHALMERTGRVKEIGNFLPKAVAPHLNPLPSEGRCGESPQRRN